MSPTLDPVPILCAANLLSYRLQNFTKGENGGNDRAHRFEVPILMDPSHILPYLREHPIPQKLYFKNRNSSFQVAAFSFSYHDFGPAFTEEVYLRLTAVLDKSKPNMRFYGGHRFDETSSKFPHPHWAPYHGYTFVLPAVEIFCDDFCNVSMAINFYPPTGFDHILQLLASISPPSIPFSSSRVHFTVPQARSSVPLTDFDTWNDSMDKVLHEISAHAYEKIVLARQKQYIFHSECPPEPLHILSALINQNEFSSSSTHIENSIQSHPYYFCLQIDNNKAFLSCTPERLFRYDGETILTEALAGTVKRAPIHEEKCVLKTLFNEKNLKEHQFVVDYVTDAMSRCGFESLTDGPHVRKLSRLLHLSTKITAEKSKIRGREEIKTPVFQFLSELHPTPAVCGVPLKKTLPHIAKLEGFDRGFFAGPFGWISSIGAEFCVAIRSANIFDQYLTAYAGCGIVNESESVSEWEETELKLSAFTDLLSPHCTSLMKNRLSYTKFLEKDDTQSDQLYIGIGQYDTKDRSVSSNFGNMKGYITNNWKSEISKIIGPNTIESSKHNNFGNIIFDTTKLNKEPNLNSLWGACAIEELIRNKVLTFFVCPGSRSAPLTSGVRRNKNAQYIIAHDERGAAYMAVGYARATCCAAAVITSSGTAVANLLPAVVEAWMEELPIIILTADRPPELRDVGANQAIFQPGIFGNYVVWSKDLACPCEDIPVSNLLSDIDFAVYKSGSESLHNWSNANRNKGPVHLNFMFRENLAPDEQPWNRAYLNDLGPEWTYSNRPMTNYISTRILYSNQIERFAYMSTSLQFKETTSLFDMIRRTKKGVIILGGGKSSPYGEDDRLCVYQLSEMLNWPIISDICGGLRLDASFKGVINNIDTLLLSTSFRKQFKLNGVLQFGEHVTSKRVQNWIKEGKRDTEKFIHILVTSTSKRIDESFTVTHRIDGNVYSVWNSFLQTENISSLESSSNIRGDIWYEKLIYFSSKVEAQMELLLNEMRCNYSMNEILCARTISECVGTERVKSLYIGNSMPIRDLDMYGSKKSGRMGVRIVGNRGASGIDGIISSGIGFITGCCNDITIVIGDMSAIHDLNALHALRRDGEVTTICHGRVTIVVVNNGGGGIFAMLPISKYSTLMSPLFDTPHSTTFDGIYQMFGIEHVKVHSVDQLRKELTDSNRTHKVIEVTVPHNHSINVNIHKKLSEKIVQFIDKI